MDYSSVTEMAGDRITVEQVDRLSHRYYWAATFCGGKDVIEAACGTGPGLGLLAKVARSLRAGDYTDSIVQVTRQHYSDRIDLRQFDAQNMPYENCSADVVVLFEAIYYLPSAERFVEECKRVLRKDGRVLVATANKDLYDFTPSPFSHVYYGVVELNQLFARHGFSAECFGYLSIGEVSLRQRILRPIKKLATDLGLVPKTTAGKRYLKRLVFGKLVGMPAEITEGIMAYRPPVALPLDRLDREHKVIYCVATLRD